MISYNQHIRVLVKLGTPLIVAQIGMIIMGLADTLMVGRYGSTELAAAGFVNALFAIIIVFALGFSYGLTPVVGTRYGQNDDKGAARALRGGWAVNTMMAVVLLVVVAVLYANLHRLGQPAELLPLIRPYLLTQMASIPFILWFSLLKQFSDGVADTRTSMWMMLVSNAVNIAGNWVLIYGHCGLPQMGLLGAGVATLFSRIASFVLFAYIFFYTKRYGRFRDAFRQTRFSRADFFLLNRMGWPIALQMGMETASFSLCSIFLGWIGKNALAANQIMCSVSSLCFMVYYGIGAAVAVRVSHFNGRGEIGNVRRTATAGMMLVSVSGILIAGVIWLARHHLGGWFTDNAEVERILLTLMLPFVLYQLGDSMQTNYANALRGMGEVKPLMRYAFVAYVLISLPASYLFGIVMEGGARGVWLGFPLGLTVAGVLFMHRFYRVCGRG